MLWAHAMVDAIEPILHVVEDEVDDRHELFGHLGVVAFGNGVVIIAACPQAAIAESGPDDRNTPTGTSAIMWCRTLSTRADRSVSRSNGAASASANSVVKLNQSLGSPGPDLSIHRLASAGKDLIPR